MANSVMMYALGYPPEHQGRAMRGGRGKGCWSSRIRSLCSLRLAGVGHGAGAHALLETRRGRRGRVACALEWLKPLQGWT